MIIIIVIILVIIVIIIVIIVIVMIVIIIVTTYIEELDRCVRMKASRARFAFHRSPTPGNCDGNYDNGNDDDERWQKYQSQISKSLSVLEGRSFLQTPTCMQQIAVMMLVMIFIMLLLLLLLLLMMMMMVATDMAESWRTAEWRCLGGQSTAPP